MNVRERNYLSKTGRVLRESKWGGYLLYPFFSVYLRVAEMEKKQGNYGGG